MFAKICIRADRKEGNVHVHVPRLVLHAVYNVHRIMCAIVTSNLEPLFCGALLKPSSNKKMIGTRNTCRGLFHSSAPKVASGL